MNLEKNKLDMISRATGYSVGINLHMVDYTFELVKRHINGKYILELGPAEGVMTELLVADGREVTVIEGASEFCSSISTRMPGVKVHNVLFEEFESQELYDGVILGHVLEHVEDPVTIVKKVKERLVPNTGRIFAAVPNCRSIHRQAAVIMGLLSHEDDLNASDKEHGHRRVFSPETFRSCFSDAGLDIEIFGGYWLKPLSNHQIEQSWTPSMLNAFMKMGERYPDIAAEIYVVAKLPKPMSN